VRETVAGLDIFTNNEAERTIRPVKVAQRGTGGALDTLAPVRQQRARSAHPDRKGQVNA
jgi:hypothetical protein